MGEEKRNSSLTRMSYFLNILFKILDFRRFEKMRFVRKVYSMNPKGGHFPAVSFPQELVAMLSQYVIMEDVPEGILIRPAKIEPVHSG
jgi:hypothetical protein